MWCWCKRWASCKGTHFRSLTTFSTYAWMGPWRRNLSSHLSFLKELMWGAWCFLARLNYDCFLIAPFFLFWGIPLYHGRHLWWGGSRGALPTSRGWTCIEHRLIRYFPLGLWILKGMTHGRAYQSSQSLLWYLEPRSPYCPSLQDSGRGPLEFWLIQYFSY